MRTGKGTGAARPPLSPHGDPGADEALAGVAAGEPHAQAVVAPQRTARLRAEPERAVHARAGGEADAQRARVRARHGALRGDEPQADVAAGARLGAGDGDRDGATAPAHANDVVDAHAQATQLRAGRRDGEADDVAGAAAAVG